jgi:hypothetical protein
MGVPRRDLTGSQFGRWCVLGPGRIRMRTCGPLAYWLCQCECGTRREVGVRSLRDGSSASCGCLRLERARAVMVRHARTGTREHRIWLAMKQRCLNPRHAAYPFYGGRGIQICPVWQTDFTAFLRDMGECPPGMSLDRINNDGNYEPGNCRWVTRHEQMRNTRRNLWVTIGDRTQCVEDWAREVGLDPETLRHRFHQGWSPEAIVYTPGRQEAHAIA